jgi:hypothetical protein
MTTRARMRRVGDEREQLRAAMAVQLQEAIQAGRLPARPPVDVLTMAAEMVVEVARAGGLDVVRT